MFKVPFLAAVLGASLLLPGPRGAAACPTTSVTSCPAPSPYGLYRIQAGPAEGKDTSYGNVYLLYGSPNDAEMSMGGWGDRYENLIRFDVSGAPSPSNVVSVVFGIYVTNPPPNDPQMEVRKVLSS